MPKIKTIDYENLKQFSILAQPDEEDSLITDDDLVLGAMADKGVSVCDLVQYCFKLRKSASELMDRLSNRARCAGHKKGGTCRAVIWWIEHTNGRKGCYNDDGTSHWSTCPDVKLFHKPKPAKENHDS